MTYDIFYTDPPWPQQKGNKRKCRPNQGKELDYSTLTLSEIKDIHAEHFKSAATRHNVFMWTIDKYLHAAEQMGEELGYKLHARFIWDKTNGVAPAFTVRFSHEYLLWLYKPGAMLMPSEDQRGKYMTVLREPAARHSRKPDCAYEMLEKMFPNTNRIELFARNRRAGWTSWGDEVD